MKDAKQLLSEARRNMRRALTFAEEGSYAEAAQFLRSAADAFEAEAKRGHVSIDRGKE